MRCFPVKVGRKAKKTPLAEDPMGVSVSGDLLLCIDVSLDARKSGLQRNDIHKLCGGGIEQGFAGAE